MSNIPLHNTVFMGRRTRLRSRDRRLSVRGYLSRMLLFGTLYFSLRGIDEPNTLDIEKLNAKFRIVSRVDALWLPALLNKMFWRKASLLEQCNKYRAGFMPKSDLIEYIRSKVPRVARYQGLVGDIDKILTDYLIHS